MSRRVKLALAAKKRWFNRGAAALAGRFPQLEGRGYCCPVCLRASEDIRRFTAEDVPPYAVGGRPLVLTCKDCNDRGGHQLDWHWANFARAEAFVIGELAEPVTARFSCGEITTTVEITSIQSTLTSKVVKKASAPKAMAAQKAILRQADGTSFTVSFDKNRFSEWSTQLSVIRAAYLMAFALTGYRFMGVWEPIRDQLRHHAEKRLTRLTRYDPTLPRDRRELAVIYEPKDCWNLTVGFGRWTAFVPFAADSRLYRPILEEESFEFHGDRLGPWPMEPTFGLSQLRLAELEGDRHLRSGGATD